MYRRNKEISYFDEIARVYPGKLVKDITFQVTEACNLRCTYCYQICKTNSVLDFDTARKFIDTLYENSVNEPENIAVVLNFIGGEPFLQTELIDEIVSYWVLKGAELRHSWAKMFMIGISTNGTLTREPEVQSFIQKWKAKLSISVSLDGNRDLHDACRVYPDGRGSYDEALASVLSLRYEFGDIPTKMTFAPENIEFMFEAFQNLIYLGYKCIHSNVIFEEGWTLEHARIEFEQLTKTVDWLFETNNEHILISTFNEEFYKPLPDTDTQNWCGGDGRMIAVNHTGKIYPCLRYMESSLGDDVEPIVCGHVDEGIQVGKLADMKTITRQSQSTEECLNCPVAGGCAWCTAYNYQKFGTINKRATFICWMHRAESLANVYFWNRVYLKYGIERVFPRTLPDELALQITSQEQLDLIDKLLERSPK